MRQQLLPCRGNPNLFVLFNLPIARLTRAGRGEIGHPASNLFVGAKACTQARARLASTAHDRFAVITEDNDPSPS